MAGQTFTPCSQGLETGLLEAIFPLGQKLSITGVSHGGGPDHSYNNMIAQMAQVSATRQH